MVGGILWRERGDWLRRCWRGGWLVRGLVGWKIGRVLGGIKGL